MTEEKIYLDINTELKILLEEYFTKLEKSTDKKE